MANISREEMKKRLERTTMNGTTEACRGSPDDTFNYHYSNYYHHLQIFIYELIGIINTPFQLYSLSKSADQIQEFILRNIHFDNLIGDLNDIVKIDQVSEGHIDLNTRQKSLYNFKNKNKEWYRRLKTEIYREHGLTSSMIGNVVGGNGLDLNFSIDDQKLDNNWKEPDAIPSSDSIIDMFSTAMT